MSLTVVDPAKLSRVQVYKMLEIWSEMEEDDLVRIQVVEASADKTRPRRVPDERLLEILFKSAEIDSPRP